MAPGSFRGGNRLAGECGEIEENLRHVILVYERANMRKMALLKIVITWSGGTPVRPEYLR